MKHRIMEKGDLLPILRRIPVQRKRILFRHFIRKRRTCCRISQMFHGIRPHLIGPGFLLHISQLPRSWNECPHRSSFYNRSCVAKTAPVFRDHPLFSRPPGPCPVHAVKHVKPFQHKGIKTSQLAKSRMEQLIGQIPGQRLLRFK